MSQQPSPPARAIRKSGFLDRHFKGLALAPAIILLGVLTIYPIANLFAMAVSTIEFKQAKEIWSFTPERNFQQLLKDEVFRIAVWNTVKFAAASVVIEVALGLALAILVSSIQAFKGLMRTLLILPVLMPPVAIGSMWKLMYSHDFGVLNQIATGIGFAPVNWTGSTSLALWSVVLVDIWHWTPFVFLILFAAVEGLSRDVIEAARIDGARNWDLTVKIVIPLLMPAIVVALLFRSIFAFKVFDQIFLLTSGGPGTSTEVVSLHLYKVFFQQNELGYGALLSLAIIASTISFLWVARRASAGLERH